MKTIKYVATIARSRRGVHSSESGSSLTSRLNMIRILLVYFPYIHEMEILFGRRLK